MQPLNPFLSAFSKSPLAAQCVPVRQHILLVPLTSVLLAARDAETGAPLSDTVGSDEFLGSHVLRFTGQKAPGAGGKEGGQNLREMRGKAKVYTTVNGRSIVIKDNLVYSNKGFKSLTHANLLHDAIWYPDSLDSRPYLIYYISQPLVGSWDEATIVPAVLPSTSRASTAPGASQPASAGSASSTAGPRKKDIKSFHELLNHFPAIARQMQGGLDKLFREFRTVFDRPLPPPPSAHNIPDPEPDGPIMAAMKRVRSNSPSKRANGTSSAIGSDDTIIDFYAEDAEDAMRVSLETAITAAIDLFQSVDKAQLSLLGATTDLTGPVVEKLIERYVTENLHHLLFPRLSALKRQDDLELEAKIRQMEYIDISQLGIALDGGWVAKRNLIKRLGGAVDIFRRLGNAMSPQETMEILLQTTKAVTQLPEAPEEEPVEPAGRSEKPALTINADTLVALLLYVVIKAQTKHLQARFAYVRHFIFIDDVESGEMGYALSTFEAVITYLDRDSSGLRRASRRNRALWDAAAEGDVAELRKIMEPHTEEAVEGDDVPFTSGSSSRRHSSSGWSFTNGSLRGSFSSFTTSERFSLGSGLSHVFPFQKQHWEEPEYNPELAPHRIVKRVALDTRSMSSGSEISFRSRATSIGTFTSVLEGDTSTERLAQTQDSIGQSVPMMTIHSRNPEALKYVLSLSQYYPPDVLMEDKTNDNTTLLSAAVQLGFAENINILLDHLLSIVTPNRLCQYLAIQDIWGRSTAHYLFHAPFLIGRIGAMLPWRQKDKNGQTPLFALCRSYDHAIYYDMVKRALDAATDSQGDAGPLHLDDHVDGKGNTLLHIVNDAELAVHMLRSCDVDVNATNDKHFTPLMVASKYGRFDMVRALYSDPRVDTAAKELRGLTAVELAKDDEVRNKIDDLALFNLAPGPDSRTTGVVRSYFVEDSTIRFVLKSGAPVDQHSYAVTTCRRSLEDFERLAKLLGMENPASWIPSLANLRAPTQIPSKPSRATLRDLQHRIDWFLRILIAHPTFSTHEMLWEFILVPDLQPDMMEQRSKLKAETRAEKVRDEMEPLEEANEVEQFVDHARDMVRSVHYSTRSVARRTAVINNAASDLHEAAQQLARATATLTFLDPPHIAALEVYARTLMPTQSSPLVTFHTTLVALNTIIDSILKALARPAQLITGITTARREVERSYSSMSRASRWPLGLLDDARQRLNEEREEKARHSETDAQNLAKELRYTQQTVAGELAGWRDVHERIGRKAIADLARGMLVAERIRLEGMQRALRKVGTLKEQKDRHSGQAHDGKTRTAVTHLTDLTSGSSVPPPRTLDASLQDAVRDASNWDEDQDRHLTTSQVEDGLQELR
ncbi:hypothetical protein CONLIGDRAFT_566049 [Coniochaeta ligniaria NRRL 30616]|uniref:VPS9 domain-containing protein n=1 Tax=Coniochaeta ligniaria NRRL 30616 TaxID=1408157 RepID=A0A1J7J7U6_9PEZI|nr:hypothetical protein CONLIGDRAFT_566049 [Coniochaeta ligniaria NRRL 30616]